MRFLYTLLAAVLLFGGQTPLVPTTAKANLVDARVGGKQWKSDAILMQVVASRVGADGKQSSWEYGFYSPSAKGCAVVYVSRGQSRAEESGGPECQAPELKDFALDSDKAMAIARGNGITKPLASMAVSVENNRPTWTVMDGGGVAPGDVILEIDATTGAIISKITQR